MAATAKVDARPERSRTTRHDLVIPLVAEPTPGYRHYKRALDLLLGGLLLVATLPLMAVIALLCRLGSPGAVLFRQQRVACGGAEFTLLKFRTMYSDSRQRFPTLFDFSFSDRQQQEMFLQLDDDPRVTPIGRFLRRSSLDELPNLLNVVRGEMSLVGPRPELPAMLRHYQPGQLVKFAVMPGLTGLAQISGRGDLNVAETISADLEYVRQRSLRYDLSILLRTVQAVVRGTGAY